MEEIKVEMADFKISGEPVNLVATAIGSCVAVCFFDPTSKIGGLAHVMLPYSEKSNIFNPLRFANLAIEEMTNQFVEKGLTLSRLETKIVGGANLFPMLLKNDEEQMGYRNVQAVKKILSQMGIRLIAEHTGGSFGRSVKLSLETGIVTVEIKI